MQTFERGRAMSDGLGVYYEVHGGPLDGRPPMVLVGGGLMPIEIALAPDLLPRFARHRPVIAVEPQGHGHTADRPTPPSMEQMAEDVRAVLDHLKVGKAHLLGHSLGGMILTGVAIRHPDRVASLVPVSAPYTFDGMLAELVVLQRDPSHVPSPQLMPLLPTEADFASWKAVYERVNPDPKSFGRVVERLNAMLAAWPGWRPEDVAAKSTRMKSLSPSATSVGALIAATSSGRQPGQAASMAFSFSTTRSNDLGSGLTRS